MVAAGKIVSINRDQDFEQKKTSASVQATSVQNHPAMCNVDPKMALT
jgi:hypothetical protein